MEEDEGGNPAFKGGELGLDPWVLSSGFSLESWVPHYLSPPGKDAVIQAKVNGKELPGKPTIKWFKGKWQELSSKSGARFIFKESHDSDSNVRPPRRDQRRGWVPSQC